MDVDLNLQIPRPTRDASGNAVWAPVGARVAAPAESSIRFRHVAIFLLGSITTGCIVAILLGVSAYGLTHSMFVAGSVGSIALYATLIVGYHWTSQERGWADLHARFPPVGKKPLVLSALAAVAIIAFISAVHWIFLRAGVKLADLPLPIVLESRTQLPLALLLIVFVGPFTEELIFRGLLLDWLRSKMHVWPAAIILSVIFSLLHANHFSLGAIGWLAFTDRFLLALAASAFTIRYHSLRAAVVMHATFNAIGLLASVFDGT